MKYLMLLFLITSLFATELKFNVDMKTAYVDKGATYNNGGVYQPSVELSNDNITIGTWINYDRGNYSGNIEGDRLSEVDFYFVYGYNIQKLSTSVSYASFMYPFSDYATEQEMVVDASYDLFLLTPSITGMFGFDGAIAYRRYYSVALSHDSKERKFYTLKHNYGVSCAIILLDFPNIKTGLSHYEVDGYYIIHLSLFDLGVGLKYLGLIDDEVLPRSNKGGGYDTKLVASCSISRGF